jgi:hypothetical protein
MILQIITFERVLITRSLLSIAARRLWKRLLITAYGFGIFDERFIENQFQFFDLKSL